MSGILLVRYFLTGNKEVDANSQASRRMQHIDVWAQLWLFSDKLCSTFHLWNSMLLMTYFPTGKRKLTLKVPPVDEYWNTACEMFFDQEREDYIISSASWQMHDVIGWVQDDLQTPYLHPKMTRVSFVFLEIVGETLNRFPLEPPQHAPTSTRHPQIPPNTSRHPYITPDIPWTFQKAVKNLNQRTLFHTLISPGVPPVILWQPKSFSDCLIID